LKRTKQPESQIELMSAYAFAERKGVSSTSVYAKIKKGEIKTVPVGKFNLIDWNQYKHVEFSFAEKLKSKKGVQTSGTRKLTSVDLNMKKSADNSGEPLEALKEARHFQMLLKQGLSASEIGRQTGNNRMQVGNRLILATITPIEEDFLKNKTISPTEWVKLAKLVPDVEKRVNHLRVDAKVPDNISPYVVIDKPVRLTVDKMAINLDFSRGGEVMIEKFLGRVLNIIGTLTRHPKRIFSKEEIETLYSYLRQIEMIIK